MTTTSLGDSDCTWPLTRPPIACLNVVPGIKVDIVGAGPARTSRSPRAAADQPHGRSSNGPESPIEVPFSYPHFSFELREQPLIFRLHVGTAHARREPHHAQRALVWPWPALFAGRAPRPRDTRRRNNSPAAGASAPSSSSGLPSGARAADQVPLPAAASDSSSIPFSNSVSM